MSSELAGFQQRALKAEKELELLTKRIGELEAMAEKKVVSLQEENKKLREAMSQAPSAAPSQVVVKSVSTSSQKSATSAPTGATPQACFLAGNSAELPKSHTDFSWGESSQAVTVMSENNEALQVFQRVRNASKERNMFFSRMSLSDVFKQGKELVGSEITIGGWVRTHRVQGGGRFAFVHISDGSSSNTLQIVIDKDKEGFKEVAANGTGASFLFSGKIVDSKGKQSIEMQATKAVLIGESDAGKYALAKKEHTLEFLRTIAHLRPRTQTFSAVLRIRNSLAFAIHKFFNDLGFYYVHTPLITASDCEGAGEMFAVTTLLKQTTDQIPVVPNTNQVDYSADFFKKPTFLTVSGQLNVESYCCSMNNVYTFGPTFRAENSHTQRHLAEFWMIEPEMAFADIHDDMDYAESFLKYVIGFTLKTCKDDIELLEEKYEKGLKQKLQGVCDSDFVRITYTEAVDILIKSKHSFVFPPEWGKELATEHEKYLAEEIFKKPTIVYNYPRGFKAFYMRLNDDQKTVAAMDVLFPKIGEIIGGSQREERLDILETRITESGLSKEAYSHYLDLRRFGSIPHSGFGLGFERLVMYTSGMDNIRDVIPFPRYPEHADF